MIKHYIKIAFRNLWKSQIQALVGIGGLTLGLIAFTIGSYWIHYELNYDSFYKDSDRIFLVRSNTGHTIYPLKDELKNNFPEIESSGVIRSGHFFQNDGITVKTDEASEGTILHGIVYFDEFLKIFPQTVLSGNIENGKGVLLTESAAKRLYGSNDIKDKTIFVEWKHGFHQTSKLFTISGIVKDPPLNTNLQFDILVPDEMIEDNYYWSLHLYNTYIKIKENIDIEQFKKKMKTFRLSQQSDEYPLSIIPLSNIKYRSSGESFIEAHGTLLTIAIVTFLLLFSALFNFIVLKTTDIFTRTKEIALRKTIGSGFKNLIYLFYVEVIVSLVITLLLSIILFSILKNFLFQYTGVPMFGLHFYSVLFVLWIICVTIILVFTSYPIWKIYKSNIYQMIIRNKNHLRKVMLTIQLIICVFLLFCLLQIGRQFRFMTKTDLGFQKENTLQFEVSSEYKENFIHIFDNIKSNPNIENAIWSYYTFFSQYHYSWYNANKLFETEKEDCIYITPTHPDFASFFGVKVIKGRFFDREDDNGGIAKAVINEKMAKLMDMDGIIGKQTNQHNGPHIEIIGIIEDFYSWPMTKEIEPHIFVNSNQNSSWLIKTIICYVKYLPGKEKEARLAINQACSNFLPHEEIIISSFDDYVRSFYSSEKKIIEIFGTIASICLLISLLGIYSIVSLSTKQRRREIAIRKINGASLLQIISIVLKEYVLMVLIASLVALPPAYIAINKWLQHYAYSIKMNIEGIWVLVFVLLLVTIIVLQKILQVARENPAEVLKSE